MPAPRAPGAVFLSKNQTRQMENRNNAQQQALYATSPIGLPYTVDPGMATGRFTQSSSTNKWILTRLRNFKGGEAVGSLAVHAINSGNPKYTIALCETSTSSDALTVLERARGYVIGAASGGVPVANEAVLNKTVILDANKSYCVALHVDIVFPNVADVVSLGFPDTNFGPAFVMIRLGATVLIPDPCNFSWNGRDLQGVRMYGPELGGIAPFYCVALPPRSSLTLPEQQSNIWY